MQVYLQRRTMDLCRGRSRHHGEGEGVDAGNALSGVPSDRTFIDGRFVSEHADEIKNLLKNENEKTAKVNPLARIMEIRPEADRLVVTTTTEHLAQQLGRSLGKAFGGDVRYDFSHENKLARVHWHRD